MDARKYEVIIKAAECGSLTRAGEDFGYTQSGVSHMIKAVETEFGFRIFLRGRGGVTLTEEGSRVLPYLREIACLSTRRDGADIASHIENVAGAAIRELRLQGLTEAEGDYLEPHAYSIMSKIEDPEIRGLHVMEG